MMRKRFKLYFLFLIHCEYINEEPLRYSVFFFKYVPEYSCLYDTFTI